MFALDTPAAATKPELYATLAEQARALLEGERDRTANAANLAALVFNALPELNWAGFYWCTASGDLLLGPFQGKPACVRIPYGRGVCGTSARERRTIVVPDVNAFPGHIACDTASRSECVVPVVAGGRVAGVLDLDSPHAGRFTEEDARGLEALVAAFVERTDVA